MSLKNKAVQGVKWTTLSTLVITILQFVKLSIIAVLLGPDLVGLMAMVTVIINYAQTYADMGASSAIIQRQSVTREQLSSLYWLNILFGVLTFIILLLSTPLIVYLFREPRLMELLPVASLSVLIVAIGMQFKVLIQKELKFSLLAKQEIAANVLGTLITIITAINGFGVWSLIIGQLTTLSFSTLLLVIVGWSKWTPMFHFKMSDLRGYIGFGLYQMGERNISFFNNRIDQLVIGLLLGTQALGYYNFAYNIVLQPTLRINSILTRVAYPVFSILQKEIESLRVNYIKMLKILVFVSAPILMGMLATIPIIISTVFGAEWESAVVIIQILTIVAIFKTVTLPIGSLFMAVGKINIYFYWNIVQLIITLPSIFIGANLGGLMGVSISLLVIQILLAYICFRFLIIPNIGGLFSDYILATVKPFLIAVLMGIGVILLSFIAKPTIIWLCIEVVFGILLYIILTSLFDKKQINDFRSYITLKKSK